MQDWLPRRLERGTLGRLVRYAGVSAVATTLSLVVLGTLVASNAMPPGWANATATAVGTIPSFELNRRWVWAKQGNRSLIREVGPFWLLSFLELVLSTLAVHGAAGWAASVGMGAATRTLVVVGANIGTFATLWAAQYILLDRVLFRRPNGEGFIAAGCSVLPSDSESPSGSRSAVR